MLSKTTFSQFQTGLKLFMHLQCFDVYIFIEYLMQILLLKSVFLQLNVFFFQLILYWYSPISLWLSEPKPANSGSVRLFLWRRQTWRRPARRNSVAGQRIGIRCTRRRRRRGATPITVPVNDFCCAGGEPTTNIRVSCC